MVVSIPLHKRPVYQGIFGAIFGVASVAGPLLGGVFTTSRLTWRWCFWINLPVGGVVVFILFFILHTPPSKNKDTIKQQITKLDPLGTFFFLPGVVCLLLALQWGGTTYAWGNARIIVLFILAAILLSVFVFIQFRSGDNATIPIRIITQRSIASGVYFSAISPGAMFIMIYFLPLWFQAIKGVSAVRSGIDTLPLVMSLVVASIIAGALTSKTGYYVPQLLGCSVILSVGAGLMTTLHVNTNSPHWIGYQVVFGFGLGFGMQQAGMAAQTCLGRKDVMTGVALMFFFQGLGGAVWLAVGQTIFSHSLVKHLGKVAELNPALIVNTGATDLRKLVPAHLLPAVLQAYNAALSDTFKLAAGCAAATIVAGLTMEWKNLKGLKQGGPSKGATEEQKKEKTEEKTSGDEILAAESPPNTHSAVNIPTKS